MDEKIDIFSDNNIIVCVHTNVKILDIHINEAETLSDWKFIAGQKSTKYVTFKSNSLMSLDCVTYLARWRSRFNLWNKQITLLNDHKLGINLLKNA